MVLNSQTSPSLLQAWNSDIKDACVVFALLKRHLCWWADSFIKRPPPTKGEFIRFLERTRPACKVFMRLLMRLNYTRRDCSTYSRPLSLHITHTHIHTKKENVLAVELVAGMVSYLSSSSFVSVSWLDPRMHMDKRVSYPEHIISWLANQGDVI